MQSCNVAVRQVTNLNERAIMRIDQMAQQVTRLEYPSSTPRVPEKGTAVYLPSAPFPSVPTKPMSFGAYGTPGTACAAACGSRHKRARRRCSVQWLYTTAAQRVARCTLVRRLCCSLLSAGCCVLRVACCVACYVAERQAERQQFRIAALLDERQAMLAAGPLTRHTTHIPLIVAYNLTLAFVLACATADPPRLLAAWRTWRVACCICNRAALCVVSACRYAASCSDLVFLCGADPHRLHLASAIASAHLVRDPAEFWKQVTSAPAGSASPRPSLN